MTSHNDVCKHALQSKFRFLFEKFKLYEYCYCGRKINIDKTHIERSGKHVNFCSNKCLNKAKQFVFHFEYYIKIKKCGICKRKFISYNKTKKTCSQKCANKFSKKAAQKWWNKNKRSQVVKERNRKIGINTKNWRQNKNWPAWNKDLHGKKYFKHYIKNGKNNFYERLKKNDGWFRATIPEKKIKKILKKLRLRFKHNFFTSQKQFDFLISFKKFIIILEVDGDFWHKSKLKCSDIEKRKEARKVDKKKELLIKKIKNTKKEWVVIRFWENDINIDTKKVYKLLEEMKLRSNNAKQFTNIICKIKKYYKEKC